LILAGEPAKGCLRKKAGKYFIQYVLVFDLIAVADDHADWQPDSVEPFRDVFDHAALGPGALGLGRAAQRVLDYLLAEFVRQRLAAKHGGRLQYPFARAVGFHF
jgi:hypothetical protein